MARKILGPPADENDEAVRWQDTVPPFFFPLTSTATWVQPLGQNNANCNTTAGRLVIWPLYLPERVVCDGMATNINTAAAGSSVHIAIYAHDQSTGDAGALIKATSALASTTTGAKTETFADVTLERGLYWIGYLALHQAKGTVVPSFSVMPNGTGSAPTFANGNDSYARTQTGLSSLPDPAAVTNNTPGAIRAVIWLRLRRP
jgi:hypothetical protein